MFDSKQTLTGRLADAIDLVIDFATLGEYGLEPTGPVPACQSRRRSHSPRPTARQASADRLLTTRH